MWNTRPTWPQRPGRAPGKARPERRSLCYIVRHMTLSLPSTSAVGVRELRQNLSVYLRRILAGERFEVTDRGTPVALLVPVRKEMTPLERLVAEGRVAQPPVGDLLDLPSPEGEVSTVASEALLAAREERL